MCVSSLVSEELWLIVPLPSVKHRHKRCINHVGILTITTFFRIEKRPKKMLHYRLSLSLSLSPSLFLSKVTFRPSIDIINGTQSRDGRRINPSKWVNPSIKNSHQSQHSQPFSCSWEILDGKFIHVMRYIHHWYRDFSISACVYSQLEPGNGECDRYIEYWIDNGRLMINYSIRWGMRISNHRFHWLTPPSLPGSFPAQLSLLQPRNVTKRGRRFHTKRRRRRRRRRRKRLGNIETNREWWARRWIRWRRPHAALPLLFFCVIVPDADGCETH